MAPEWLRPASDQDWLNWLEGECLSKHQIKVEAIDWGWSIFIELVNSRSFKTAVEAEGGTLDQFFYRQVLAEMDGNDNTYVNEHSNRHANGYANGTDITSTDGQNPEHGDGHSHTHSNQSTNEPSSNSVNGQSNGNNDS